MTPVRKPIHFMGSSNKDIRAMPEDVRDVFGSALLDAQYGDTPDGAAVR
jgi:phage-related protein